MEALLRCCNIKTIILFPLLSRFCCLALLAQLLHQARHQQGLVDRCSTCSSCVALFYHRELVSVIASPCPSQVCTCRVRTACSKEQGIVKSRVSSCGVTSSSGELWKVLGVQDRQAEVDTRGRDSSSEPIPA